MSSINYTTFTSQLANLLIVSSADPNFQTFLPGCIDYVELRLQRDLDFVNTTTVDTTNVLSSGSRILTLSSSWVVIEEVNVLSSAGTGSSNGTRNPLIPMSREYINYAFPSNVTGLGIPQYFNLLEQNQIIVGPTPDAGYTVEIVGTQRFPSLSASNSSNFLTQEFPDLYLTAAMVFGSGYIQNFGAQSDNPQMAASWENQYQMLLKSAVVEEARKKFQSEGWTSEQPSPIATPKRV